MPKIKKKYRLALALGGGGAKGLAHIGVLKVLEREKIPINLIVGTSMGSIIGGMYSQLGNAQAVETKVLGFLDNFIQDKNWPQLFRTQEEARKRSLLSDLSNYVQQKYIGFKALTSISLKPKETLYEPLKKVLIDNNIEDGQIPFAAISIDLINGHTKIFRKGSILTAVYASSAIEGIFPPLELDGCYLADGGPVSITPVEIALQLGSHFVVAVDVYNHIKRVNAFANGLEVMMRADSLGLDRLRRIDLAQADLVIAPDVGFINWADFGNARECIKQGELAAELALPSLVNLLAAKTWIRRLKAGARLLFEDWA